MVFVEVQLSLVEVREYLHDGEATLVQSSDQHLQQFGAQRLRQATFYHPNYSLAVLAVLLQSRRVGGGYNDGASNTLGILSTGARCDSCWTSVAVWPGRTASEATQTPVY